jgi:hypothetical protein
MCLSRRTRRGLADWRWLWTRTRYQCYIVEHMGIEVERLVDMYPRPSGVNVVNIINGCLGTGLDYNFAG